MPPEIDINRAFGVSDVYAHHLSRFHDFVLKRSTVRILVVLDGGISLTEGPSAFGVARVIRLLRESRVGCMRFEVDTARRNGSTLGSPDYTNFRFDQQQDGAPVLNRYHEVWCFGFNPGNDGSDDDGNITAGSALPTSDAELEALTRWMNERKGGLLAMGDHHYLGASMCHRIPRIRSMRRWTNAQDVPPIGHISDPQTHLRHDTNQPATPAEEAGTAIIDFLNQEDAVPQAINWVPWGQQQFTIFHRWTRPHPVLCHPTLGPIDVMPDHPHEGWCYEDHEIDLTDTFSFNGYSDDEYPTKNGVQPRPRVIAHGTTTPNPPYLLEKGPSPEKRFAMISVYDGHPVDVGRVATDSTWHHWFDENIFALEAAGGPNWDKISRYYLNVARWLAPPGIGNWCIIVATLTSHFSYVGLQEWSARHDALRLGVAARTILGRHLGPCWVSEWVIDRLRFVDDDIWKYLHEKIFGGRGPVPGGDPCLSCPPWEVLEAAVLGGLVRETLPMAREIAKAAEQGEDVDVDFRTLERLELRGVKRGLDAFREGLKHAQEEIAVFLR